ncbi:speckle-type POZ protein-like [Trichogramma pretiosum]|uniref:speckle-type POZ protein-like n=1 Tax=Trichogramma pretiosum TaxID=7493 RepID=UPI000C719D44|nr:speckle-type POZ protein-like [Trichogramma pretiosum]
MLFALFSKRQYVNSESRLNVFVIRVAIFVGAVAVIFGALKVFTSGLATEQLRLVSSVATNIFTLLVHRLAARELALATCSFMKLSKHYAVAATQEVAIFSFRTFVSARVASLDVKSITVLVDQVIKLYKLSRVQANMPSTQRIKSTTIVHTDKCIYTWTIKNYSLLELEVGEPILSNDFIVGSDYGKHCFNLELYPNGNSENQGFVTIYLCYIGSDLEAKQEELMCKYKLTAIRNGKVIKTFIYDVDFAKMTSMGLRILEEKNIDRLITSKDTVTFKCELDIFKGFLHNGNETDNETDHETDNETEDEIIDKKKFKLAFPCEEFSDVKLRTSDKFIIPAHKFVLATVSPVFRAMFTHDMLETKNNTIEITETSHNILIEMLRYIYTGEIEIDKTDMIQQLLIAADKYEIDDLKIECGKLLYAKLTTENAIEFLILAYTCNAERLENKLLRFLTTNTKLLDSELLKTADPALLLKITHSLREKLTGQTTL